MNKIDSILKEILERIKPSKEESEIIENSLKNFLMEIGSKLKKTGLDMEIFIGGSFAKKTLIKKDKYDIDIFVRFSEKYKDSEISNLAAKLLKNVKGVELVHGSRDYFRLKRSPDLFFELIPVKKAKNPKDAENITDLSYYHVRYVKNNLKDKKILDEIMIAKAFCYANNCYGAESYIQGFSGYGLELLVYYYGGFLKFIKAISKSDIKKSKIIIDIEKEHKNKSSILMDLNSSKLNSPIILIDPTYKQRNVLAALSEETFYRFKKDCTSFLKNPSIQAFEPKKTDLEKIKKEAEKKHYEFALLEAKTDKQEGDIAGSKLLKFYKHLNSEIEKLFYIKKKGFNYNDKKSARYFFVAEPKKEVLFNGPKIKDKKNVTKFKKKHSTYFIKQGKLYSKEKIKIGLKDFIKKHKGKEKTKEMYIQELKIID